MSVWLEPAPHQCSYTNQRAPSVLSPKGPLLLGWARGGKASVRTQTCNPPGLQNVATYLLSPLRRDMLYKLAAQMTTLKLTLYRFFVNGIPLPQTPERKNNAFPRFGYGLDAETHFQLFVNC